MLSAVHIQGYRGLRDFSLEPLGRINLIVGNNNSGKTSVLEAIQVFVEQDTLAPLYEITRRRNEMIEIPPKTDRPAMTSVTFFQVIRLTTVLNLRFQELTRRENSRLTYSLHT